MSFIVQNNEQTYFHAGNETHKVPMKLFEENRNRLCHRLQNAINVPENSYIFLEAGTEVPFYNTDTFYAVFKQEPFFFWAFGVVIPDAVGLIDTKTCEGHLFIPRYEREKQIQMGSPYSKLELKFIFNLKDVEYLDHLDEFIDKMEGLILLTLNGVNVDSGRHTDPIRWKYISLYRVMPNVLHGHMVECRIIKTNYEIDLLRYVARISALGHRAVMSYLAPDMMEYQGEAEFRAIIYKNGGCRYTAYNPGLASGLNTAILNYGNEYHPNTKKVADHELVICHMAASYYGYSADVCSTFPVGMTFTDEQKLIYDIVLRLHEFILSRIRPGVHWIRIREECDEQLLVELVNINVLQGDIKQMFDMHVPAYFQPHASGHMVGVGVNDVGGFNRDTEANRTIAQLQIMRLNRILDKGMVIAVESGLYFITILTKQLLGDSKTSGFINLRGMNRFRRFGGVRMVDTVAITSNGYELLSAGIPRTIQEIESFKSKRQILNVLK